MKELTGKTTESLIGYKEVTETKDLIEKTNNFVIKLGRNLRKKARNSSNPYTSFLNQTHNLMRKNS